MVEVFKLVRNGDSKHTLARRFIYDDGMCELIWDLCGQFPTYLKFNNTKEMDKYLEKIECCNPEYYWILCT